MNTLEEIRSALAASGHEAALTWLDDPERTRQCRRLVEASPLYARVLERQPAIVHWLAETAAVEVYFGTGRYAAHWQEFGAGLSGEALQERLRRFRRWHSLRLAWREVNELAPMAQTLAELSALADFCLQTIFTQAWDKWTRKLGMPWDEMADRPAQMGVLGMGKLGGRELNFCSDVDLIFLSDGAGHLKRGERLSQAPNAELFTRVAQELTQILSRRTGEGFLYNVDLRLRPDGSAGPLVHSVNAAVNYYYTRGQTWERLMLLKARWVAGDPGPAGEFLELVHSFRYPRHPPASLPQEVAALKRRTEQEVVGTERLELDLKNGRGGIREIEFFAQVLQLVHASQYPFLQTASTREALYQLRRYNMIPGELARFLVRSYDLLRTLEHRGQMRDEQQVHTLPPFGPDRESLAISLGYTSEGALMADLDARRERVRANFLELFPREADDRHEREWTDFLALAKTSPMVADQLATWFGADPEAAAAVRSFILGPNETALTRDHLGLFLDLAARFPQTLAPLARPLRTLRRISRFADHYGARRQFLNLCALNPSFFQVLALLFDRSEFICRLLCRHPEIMDELLARPVRRHKSVADLREDLAHGPAEPEAFARWLWLFVKAEQVRASINGVLDTFDLSALEEQLTALADAVLAEALERLDPAGDSLLIIALGKYGAGELALGSDLDLLLIGRSGDEPTQELARRLQRLIGRRETDLGRTFDLDFRLRPHGDSGALVITQGYLEAYHARTAQPWERQLLTRARVVTGPADLAAAFEDWRLQRLFGRPFTPAESAELDRVRQRILAEKADTPEGDERAFKAGRGGLIDLEFLGQRLQLQHGAEIPALRTPRTREMLVAAGEAGLLDSDTLEALLAAYTFYRRIELHLRRQEHAPVVDLPADEPSRHDLARWMGLELASFNALYHQHRATVAERIGAVLGGTS